MIGDFYDGFEGFWRQMLLNLLKPFPASELTFLIFGWWDGFETTIGAVKFEKSAAGQEFNHRDFIFWFWIF